MNSYGLGDLAQTFLLQRRGADIKTDVARLTEELASGQVSDTKSILSGNVAYLTDIESDLRSLSAYKVAGTEAAQFATSVQSALGRIDAGVEQLSTNLLSVAASASGPVLDHMSKDAESELQSLVSTLNTSSAGRSIFSGAATERPALSNADEILNDLRAAIAGNTTLHDVETAVEQWFDDTNGFRAAAYTGSDSSIQPFQLAEDEQVAIDLKADDQVFRDLLKGVALAAVAADGVFGLSVESQRELLEHAGTRLLTAKEALTAMQGDIGASEARIDTIGARNAARDTSLQLAKGALLRADPYETATQLEAVQFQLQSLYTITARMSDLSLVNFIR